MTTPQASVLAHPLQLISLLLLGQYNICDMNARRKHIIFYFAVLLKHVGCLLAKKSEVVHERTGLISSTRLLGLQPGSAIDLLRDLGHVTQCHSASISFCKMELTVLPTSLVAVRICVSIYLPSVIYLSIYYLPPLSLSCTHTHTHIYEVWAHRKHYLRINY